MNRKEKDIMEITLEALFRVFFIAICIDFITGVLVAAKEGRLRSRTCSNGMFRSIGECIVLCIFLAINYYIPTSSNFLLTFIIGFIFKEGLSIIENLVGLDVWIPESIKNTLQVGTDKIDKLNN